MSCFAPTLRPFLLFILAFVVSAIDNHAVAEEFASALKSGAEKPWQVSLTVQRSRQALKPILSPLGQGTLGSVMPSLLADPSAPTNPMGISPFFAPPAMAPSPTTPTAFGFQGRTPLSIDPVGLPETSTLMLGILDSAPPLPTILGSTVLGDATGNGEIDFVDRSNALIPMGSSSTATQLGGGN